MKRLMIVLAVLFVFSASAYAQMGMTGGAASGEQKGEMKPCGMMMSEEQQMPMCQQMMMGQNMMMKDMMQMMMEMLNMQESMMKGLKAEEKEDDEGYRTDEGKDAEDDVHVYGYDDNG